MAIGGAILLNSLFHDPWWGVHAGLALPLLFTLVIAWRDLKTRRIPNYLTLGAALAGLGFQLGFYGWGGLVHGLLGLALGFGLLLIPYLLGGMGAGDVKALAALGAWLGPGRTFQFFLYMAIAGGLIALAALLWKGLLGARLRQTWHLLLNWMLSRPHGLGTQASPGTEGHSIPYGVAMALGMMALFIIGE
jgi:prepilin peptidase CpaA